MDKPLVSIVIPVYNGANYLREAIESAIKQTYENIEIIVVNDGSNDNGKTERIALSFGNEIKYYPKENGGVATALNYAIEHMNGEYFSWLSHDDLYYPYKIERQLDALEAYGKKDIVINSSYDVLDMTSGKMSSMLWHKSFSKERLETSVYPVLKRLISGCALLIHKSCFERSGLFNTELPTTQDYDMWFRLLLGMKSVYIEEPLICVRTHSEQGSRTIKTHNKAEQELYINFIKTLQVQDIMQMQYKDLYSFYGEMALQFLSSGDIEIYHFANQYLQNTDMPQNSIESRRRLAGSLNGLSGGKASNLCIFCTGFYGMNLYHDLHSKLVCVDFFSDNNPNKWGELIHGISCVSMQELEEHKHDTLIIVANKNPKEIAASLKAHGFLFVTTVQEINCELEKTPPNKWILSINTLYKYQNCLSDHMVFEICKYYEDCIS